MLFNIYMVTEELLKDAGGIKHGDQLSLGFSSVDPTGVCIPVGLSSQQTCFQVLIDIGLKPKQSKLARQRLCVQSTVNV